MKKIHYWVISICCCVIVVICGYCCWWGSTTTVIVVRHAERATTADTSPLSHAGEARAGKLADAVEKAGISAIFVTDKLRTQQTADTVEERLGITPQIIPETDTDVLINTIFSNHKGKKILVVGHSQTIEGILQGLGISSPPVVDGNEYDNMFLVHIRHWCWRRAWLTHLQYGEPSPPPLP